MYTFLITKSAQTFPFIRKFKLSEKKKIFYGDSTFSTYDESARIIVD